MSIPSASDMPAHDDCAHPELHQASGAALPARKNNGGPGRLDPQLSAKITRRVTSYSVAVGFVLVVLKFVIWRESGSVGILSSLVHSGLDMIAALATFFGVRYAASAPDKVHSYGRGKAEGIVAILQACLVIFSAAHIAEHGIERFMNPQAVEHGLTVLLVMAFAVALTFCLVLAQGHAIASTGSVAIRGDRAHFFADMLANIAVIIGVAIAAFTPFARADSVVAICVAIWLAFTAVKVGRLAYHQLMDQELAPGERDYIESLALSDKRITGVKALRTRASGPHIHIQMHVDLPADMDLKTAADITRDAETRILGAFPAADVTLTASPAGQSDNPSRFRPNA